MGTELLGAARAVFQATIFGEWAKTLAMMAKDNKDLIKLPGMEKTRTAAFWAAHRCDGTTAATMFVGSVTDGVGPDHMGNAFQRAQRAFLSQNARHTGAVVGRNFVWSVAGYLGDVDSILAIIMGWSMRDISEEGARQLAATNPHRGIMDEAALLVTRR